MAAADQLPSGADADGAPVVRVLSYNIRSLRDDRDAVVRVIRACAPDLVCIQEAPRFFRWRKKAAWLARDCGLYVVTGGAPAFGTLLLSSLRATVLEARDVPLERTPGLHQRGFATATLGFGPARLAVAACHLSLDDSERHEQAGALLAHLKSTGQPHAVAAGDLNERPGGETWHRLTTDLRDAYATAPWGGEHTSPATAPTQRIDAIFTTPAIEVLACGVPRDLPGITDTDLRAATDHLPVLAALRLPRTPPSRAETVT